MNIGEKIRHIRIQKGLSQENLAEQLRISTTAYGDIERNKTEVSVRRLLKISELLGVEACSLLNDKLKDHDYKAELEKLTAELVLAKIEAERWKERFMRAVFNSNQPLDPERQKIGFK
jgi:XRE family transcriptional regulator, regulator of sulfur utilization